MPHQDQDLEPLAAACRHVARMTGVPVSYFAAWQALTSNRVQGVRRGARLLVNAADLARWAREHQQTRKPRRRAATTGS